MVLGRRARLGALLFQSALGGTKARKRAAGEGITLEQAARCNRIEQAKVAGAFVCTKEGRPLRRLSRRKLAVAYAIESVEATRKKKGGLCSQLGVFAYRECGLEA